MQWLPAVGGWVLMMSGAVSLAWVGCASNSQPCADCDQTLIGTGARPSEGAGTGGAGAVPASGDAGAAWATGGAEDARGVGGAQAGGGGGNTGGVSSAASGAAGITGGTAATSPEPCSRVDGPTAESLVAQGALLLDVRTAEEYASGHAQGAVNIAVEELSGRIGELPTGRAIVVYCRSGNRSSQAAALLCDQGFEVYDLGAISNWSGALAAASPYAAQYRPSG